MQPDPYFPKSVIGTTLVIVILAACWWSFSDRPKKSPDTDVKESEAKAPLVSPLPTAPTQSQPNFSARRQEQMRDEREIREMSRTPILFFGRVLDEMELPVKGAKVVYTANTIDVSLTQEGHITGTVYSDAKGMFEISQIRSRGIGFDVSHPDYYASGKNPNGASYAGDRDRNIPDAPSKAWVFRMYKKKNPAKLLNSSGGGHAQMDGSPLNIKLDKYGQIRAEGKRSKPQTWDGKPFDWELRLTVPNGGIAERTDEITFEAPTEGYKPEYVIVMSKDDKNWKSELDRSFYVKSGNVFGRVDATISIYHDLFFSVHYTINADGSTNLESGNGARITGP